MIIEAAQNSAPLFIVDIRRLLDCIVYEEKRRFQLRICREFGILQ